MEKKDNKKNAGLGTHCNILRGFVQKNRERWKKIKYRGIKGII